jgi:hypothetical protein
MWRETTIIRDNVIESVRALKVGIPAKPNAKSGMNPNGIPG